jgi:hypothetical protein
LSKIIQENFGEAIIAAVIDFAKRDLSTVDQLTANEFAHVSDQGLRTTLAETFYGARWIYKLGLALLVRDVEQMAHVRTQVMDFGAVCEGLLSDSLLHALRTNRLCGQKYLYSDSTNLTRPINWQVNNQLTQLSKQSFFWHIEVAHEENIINQGLFSRLHALRIERNTVHMRARTHKAFVGTSKSLFDVSLEAIRQTRNWRRANP